MPEAYFRAVVVVVAGMVCLGRTDVLAESYRSLRLDNGSGLAFAADPRLTFGQEGTVELWLAAGDDAAGMQCVLAHGDPAVDGFAVLLAPERQAIALQAPGGTYQVPFDFSDGQYHHVAITTAGRQTAILIDGATPAALDDAGDPLLDRNGEPESWAPGWFGFGAAPLAGLTLEIGCADPAPFDGWLAAVRFWDKALTPDELEWTKSSYGYPDIEFDARRQAFLDQHLIAYATFTDERQSLFYTEPALRARRGGEPGAASTTTMLQRRLAPNDAEAGIVAIHARVTRDAVEQLRFEYPGWAGVPVILPPLPGWTSEDQVRLDQLRGEIMAVRDNERQRDELIAEARYLQLGFPLQTAQVWTDAEQNNLDSLRQQIDRARRDEQRREELLAEIRLLWPEFEMSFETIPLNTEEALIEFDRLIKEVDSLGDAADRREGLSALAARMQLSHAELVKRGGAAFQAHQWVIIPMRPGETPSRIVGTHGPGSIQRMSIETNQRRLPLLSAATLSGDIFSVALPDHARYEGVEFGRAADGKLQTLGLVWSDPGVPDAEAPLVALTGERWVAEDSCPPRLADEVAHQAGHSRPLTGIARLHGFYTTPSVGRFFFDPRWQSLELYLDHIRDDQAFHDFGSCGAMQLGDRFLDSFAFARQTHSAANPNRLFDTQTPPSGISLVLKEQGRVVTPNGPLPTGALVRAPQPATGGADKDKIAWGGTFALPHRPANVRANFVGYDITQLDPHNFLRSHGLKQHVFAYPADDSTDYQTTDNNLIVPNGVWFKSDVGAVEDAHTVMVADSFEYKYAWSMSIGVNLGFGMDGIAGAFSANASYAKRSASREARKVITSITRTAEVHYAMIADRGRIELSPEFGAQVLALRDAYLVGQMTDDSVGHLIRLFGTHYPYAVTYGGMAFLETDYSEKVVGHMEGRSRSFEEQASLSFSDSSKSNGCGCSGGGGDSASFGIDVKVSDDRELSTEVQNSIDSHIFGTYGGSVSRGEGWSLAPGQEVPLFLDLRPLHELLSPLFFDDPIVWEVLAPALARQIQAHLRRAVDADRDARPGWYDTNRENALRRHEPRVFDHAYKAGERAVN